MVLSDPGIAADVANDLHNGSLSYSATLSILEAAAAGGMTASKFSTLQAFASELNSAGGISVSPYVQQVADDAILGNSANATWNGGAATATALGDLSATSSQTQADELIGEWFLGTNLPSLSLASVGQENLNPTYQTSTLSLYGPTGAPTLQDVNQGYLGDCYFVSSLGEVALKDPAAIENMISSNGNGTYSVRFFVNGQPDYVTVNSELPVMTGYEWANGSKLEFANGTTDDWVALVEKAYAQLNAQTSAPHGMQLDSASDSYAGITAGGGSALTLITGQQETPTSLSPGTSASSLASILSNLASSFSAGEEILMSTPGASSGNLVGDHMYMVTGVNPSTGLLTIRNPWNTAYGGSLAMSFTGTIQQLAADNCTLWVTSGSPVATPESNPPAAPTVAIASAGALDDAATQTITGTIDVADAGTTVDIYDGTSLVGSTTANSSGNWSTNVTLSGAGLHALTARATDLSDLTGVSDARYLATTGGQAINFADASGDAASLYNAGGASDGVYSGSDSEASLSSTIADWDLLNGSNARVYLTNAEATLIGGGDAISLSGSGDEASLVSTVGSWDLLNGSDATVYLTNAWATVIGGGDTINCTGSGNEASLLNTGGNWDLLNGSNATVYLTNAQATVIGGGDTIDCTGSGNEASFLNTGGNWDLLNGSNATVYLTNAEATVIGGGDTINLSGSGDEASLVNTGGSWDLLNGSDATVYLTNAQATVDGDAETINLTGTNAFEFQPAFGHDVINGFGSVDTMDLSHLDFASWSALQGDMTQSGANTVITLDPSDSITLNNVMLTSLTPSQFHFV